MTVTIGRRELLAALGGAAATWPLAARAQQPERMRRIGVLMGLAETDQFTQGYVRELRDRLQQLGWTDGRKIQFTYRCAELAAQYSHSTPTPTAVRPSLPASP
jgi:putative ABC transport system substrate-binding protein